MQECFGQRLPLGPGWDPDESAEFAKARRDAVKDLLGDQEDQDPSAFGFSRQ